MPRRRSKSKEHDFSGWVRVLAILGGILAIILGIITALTLLEVPFTILSQQLTVLIISIISGIVNIVLGIVLLAAFGVIKTTKKFSANWFILIIIGIVMLLFGGIAGILVLIAGILDIVGILSK